MKLATYKDGSRDGQLVVVSRDLSTAHYATGIAHTLGQVLDDWNFLSPQLQDLSHTLNQGKARHAFAFEPERCMAPLPRASRWVSGGAYLHHRERIWQAQGLERPASMDSEPLMFPGAGDALRGPCEPVRVPSEDLGIDFEAGLAVATGDLPVGASPDEALEGIRLVMLVNDTCLRSVAEDEQARGAGLCQGRPATAFGPVAVSLDELGQAWQGGRLHLTMHSSWNGRRVGLCEAGPEMHFHFGQLMAQLCRTRSMRAGTLVGSGAVSSAAVDKEGRPHWPKGYACIADKRAMETLLDGQPSTAFMKWGDRIRIEMKDALGQSVFGAIDQEIAPLG